MQNLVSHSSVLLGSWHFLKLVSILLRQPQLSKESENQAERRPLEGKDVKMQKKGRRRGRAGRERVAGKGCERGETLAIHQRRHDGPDPGNDGK